MLAALADDALKFPLKKPEPVSSMASQCMAHACHEMQDKSLDTWAEHWVTYWVNFEE